MAIPPPTPRAPTPRLQEKLLRPAHLPPEGAEPKFPRDDSEVGIFGGVPLKNRTGSFNTQLVGGWIMDG